jgi:hypothetical protein
MRTTTVNYLLYQAGWLAAVLGTAAGHEGMGTVFAGACLVAHVTVTREPAREWRLVVTVTLIGLVVELFHRLAGTYDALSTLLPPPLPPLWLLVLWAQFGTTLRYSLRGIVMRPIHATLFGAVGGPLAFWAVSRLGAIELHSPQARALVLIAVTWALALLAFSAIVRRDGESRPPTYRYDR